MTVINRYNFKAVESKWQEKWENLPNIKSSLSDGLLKALDTTQKKENVIVKTSGKKLKLFQLK